MENNNYKQEEENRQIERAKDELSTLDNEINALNLDVDTLRRQYAYINESQVESRSKALKLSRIKQKGLMVLARVDTLKKRRAGLNNKLLLIGGKQYLRRRKERKAQERQDKTEKEKNIRLRQERLERESKQYDGAYSKTVYVKGGKVLKDYVPPKQTEAVSNIPTATNNRSLGTRFKSIFLKDETELNKKGKPKNAKI